MNAAKKATAAPLTVSQAAAALDGVIRSGFMSPVRIVGEVGNFTDRTHWYFDLKDDSAVLACVAFASVAKRSAVAVRSGVRLVVTGRFELYTKTGRVSLMVDKIEAAGQGSLAERLRVLVDELRALGWLDPSRKRPLPLLPRRVAVITSRTGAALQDVLVTMKRRCPAVGVLVVDIRVQGDSAAPEATAAIREVSGRAVELGLDAVILTRGGGSMEDLWPFNDRELARAIVECSVPVVAAIGHETDVTLAELVADERAATPTLAATRLTPDSTALLRAVDSTQSRLTFALRGRLDSASLAVQSLLRRPALAEPGRSVRARIDELNAVVRRFTNGLRAVLRHANSTFLAARSGLDRARPAASLARESERLRNLERRLSMENTLAQATLRVADAKGGLVTAGKLRAERATPEFRSLERRLRIAGKGRASDASQRLEGLAKRLHSVSPIRVLERGFSITTLADGSVLRSVGDAAPGTILDTLLTDGTVRSTAGGSGRLPTVGPSAPAPKARSRPPRESGPGLFGA